MRSKDFRQESWRRKFAMDSVIEKASPNIGHNVISQLVNDGQVSLVITQNVDGLHQASGIAEDIVVELHGNSTYARCLSCQMLYALETIKAQFLRDNEPPLCTNCEGLIKTATISFGQPMPEKEVRRAETAAKAAKLFIVVGSSLVVYPAAGLPVIAKQQGAKLVIINREPTELDGIADLVINAEIGVTLSALVNNP